MPSDSDEQFDKADMILSNALQEFISAGVSQEVYGMAMLEAQAAGLPVAAGRTGGVPDVVRDGRTGVLCPVGDAAAFAASAADLLDAPARLDAMRASALSLTAAENDIAVAARRLDEILQTTVKARAV